MKNTLKKLIESEVKAALNEAMVIEPSEQVIKAMMKVLKLKTGIIATVTLDQTKPNVITYAADLSKEIRTPIMQSLFSTLTLDISCRAIPQSIGGYAFDISINYTHPQGGSNGKNLGTIFLQNGKFTSRIY
jgi:hypothetical protein